jgi:protein gp37
MFAFLERVGKDPTVVRRTAPATFDAPLKTMKPRIMFTCSMSDYFHKDADPWRAEAWDIIRQTPQHTYLVLTKRHGRLRKHLPWTDRPWPHVWLGVSVENQKFADQRIPILLDTPAAHRFLSLEPLIGPIDLGRYIDKIDWVIIGGRSGTGWADQPMEVAWVESLVAQCDAAGVPVYVKQDGGQWPEQQGRLLDALWAHKVLVDEIPDADVEAVVAACEVEAPPAVSLSPEDDYLRLVTAWAKHFDIPAPTVRLRATCHAVYNYDLRRKGKLREIAMPGKPPCKQSVRDALIHEFTHHLLFMRNDSGSSHGESFRAALVEVATHALGDPKLYEWHQDYTRVEKWAIEQGLTESMAPAVASTP